MYSNSTQVRSGFVELTQLESIELFTGAVTSQTVHLNVLFPSGYHYYFELVSDTETPILIDHPFRLYFPQTIMVEWAFPSGVYLTFESAPEFAPFGPLTIQVYLPQALYDAVAKALENPIGSLSDLVPIPEGNACGVVEFVLLSTEDGIQVKLDLTNSSYIPEVPVTVKTLQWNEILYDTMNLPFSPPLPPPPVFSSTSFGFAYTIGGDLGITFIDPRYCFLREWILFPQTWTAAIKDFAGV